MRLFIHGVGFFGMGLDVPFETGTGQVPSVPIKDYAKAGFTRRFGRLAKLKYIASSKALDDAGVDDASQVATVGATALGEANVSIDLITQIQATRGKTISPKLVPNSVHNSPVGYLSIGKKNHEPSLTVSQGWLCAEAGLAAARDLIEGGFKDRVLVVAGDEADPSWAQRLKEMGADQWAKDVEKEAFQECAVAVVLGKAPGGRNLGSIAAGVERIRKGPDHIKKTLLRNGALPGEDAVVKARAYTQAHEFRETAATALGRDLSGVQVEPQGIGTTQAGSLASLVLSLLEGDRGEQLLLAFELGELSFVHFMS